MITLHLAIYDGEPKELKFKTFLDLRDYVLMLKDFDCIWLITNGDQDKPQNQEIVITENIIVLVKYIDAFKSNVYFIQQYQSYEDAYRVALDMRETNSKCYSL
jgi:hypothetical protein